MSSTAPLPTLRWLGPLGLLLGEYLLISLQFDALPLLHSAGWTHGFGHLGIAAPLAFVVATLGYVLAGDQVKSEFAGLLGQPLQKRQVWSFLVANLVCYGGLIALTVASLARVRGGQDVPFGWLIAFLLLAAATLLSLLFIVVPPRAAAWLVKSSRQLLLISVGAGALAWIAGVASGALWDALRKLTLDTVYLMISPFTQDIGYAPEDAIIGVGEFFVVVAPECSGLEGIGLIVVVLAVYLWSARSRLFFPRALWLIPAGVALVWIGNAMRIALLLAVGVHVSPEIALSGFHSKAGWIFFCAIALALIAYVERSSLFSREAKTQPASQEREGNPTATYLAPQLIWIATSLVTGLFTIGLVDLAYGVRVAVVALVLYLARAHLPKPSWPASWHAPVIGTVTFGLWWILIPDRPASDVKLFRAELASLSPLVAAGWIGVRVVGSCLVVPIAEELAFRAFLLRRLISPSFLEVPKTQLTVVSFLVSSLAFGLLHGHDWIAATIAGAAYALAQRARGRTSDAVVAHAVTNALIAIAVLVFGAYWLWV
jgi:exosortase E/protease (VPEID-CTERM system)